MVRLLILQRRARIDVEIENLAFPINASSVFPPFLIRSYSYPFAFLSVPIIHLFNPPHIPSLV